MISARSGKILNSIVGQYITRAVPVPSQVIASDSALGLSPATVRNEMAYLEQEGYLIRPHTSAGCIPSDKGYRYYVESIENIILPPAEERLTLVEGQGSVVVSALSPTAYDFRVSITEQARLRVNTFYFPGWTLYVDGVERPIQISHPEGLMEFPLESGEHLVEVRFQDTPVRLWATRLSLLALLLLLLTTTISKRWASSRSGE